MDLRSLPDDLSSAERCEERRRRIEEELGVDLSALAIDPITLGHAEERNCEQMFGHVPIPLGYAGSLRVIFSSGEEREVHMPLATTEGALVASVNRGCKALALVGGIRVSSTYHGVTRSLALEMPNSLPVRQAGKFQIPNIVSEIRSREHEWKVIGESTSTHLKILHYDLDEKDGYVFLTIACDTDEAMGMNMVTIAAQKIGEWLAENLALTFVTVAGNVDSDKKPSKRTHDRGRGYEVIAEGELNEEVIRSILKTTPEALFEVARAKLELGSEIAGAMGKNLHAANVIAALYLATGQDASHVVEGSMADTVVSEITNKTQFPCLKISTRIPALMLGIRGGGTTLPAQAQALSLLLKPETTLHPCKQLAESIGAAVLAGEVSLLAAQASHELAKSHKRLGR